MQNIFNLIAQLKGVKKEKLVVDAYDIEIMKLFHKKLKGVISFRLWKKIVINYSIETTEDIYSACDELLDIIYEKYKKNKKI